MEVRDAKRLRRLEDELGYSKYDYRNKGRWITAVTDIAGRKYRINMGEVEIEVPRDRKGEYEPELVKKHQRDISLIEDKIIYLYFQGISTLEIEWTIREMYGIKVDDSRVSKITDKL